MAAAVAAPLAGLGAWGLQFLAVWLLGLVLGWLVSSKLADMLLCPCACAGRCSE